MRPYFDQNFSVDTWGTEYLVTPFSFASTYTYRVLADENGTTFSVNSGASYNLQAGQYQEFNGQTIPNCITSNKPISVIQMMEGVSCAGDGDPSMLVLNSTREMIDKVTFSTVASQVITRHQVNVIMETSFTNQLQLDGVPVASNSWTAFPSCSNFSYARLPLTQGSHTLEADSGFTAYVYGTGTAESYAYSVGSFTPLEPLQPDSILCTDDTVRLGASTPLFNTWWSRLTYPNDTIATGPSLTLYPPLQTDIYILTGDHFVTGCSEQFFFSVEVTQPPNLNMFAASDTICENQSVQLLGIVTPPSAAYQYEWTPATGLSNPFIADPLAAPPSSMWYYLTVETFSVCSSVEDSIYIEVKPAAIEDFDAITDRTQVCVGDSAQLDAQLSNVIYEELFDPAVTPSLWTTINNGTAVTGCGSFSGNALYFNGPGLRSAETVDLNLSTGGYVEFMLKVGTGLFPCEDADPGMDIVLEYSVNGGGNWVIMETYDEADYPLFTRTKAWLPPPARTPSTRFRFRQLFNGGANVDNWAIDEIRIGVNYYTGFTLGWSPGASLSDPSIADPKAGPLNDITYYLTATDTVNGCDYSDSVSLVVPQPFTITMPNDTTLCSSLGFGLPVQDDANTVLSYNWSPGTLLNDSTSRTPAILVDSSVTYTVEVSDSSGCYVRTGSVVITVTPPPSLSVSGDTTMCLGDSAQLIASSDPGVTYIWTPSTGLNNPSISDPKASPLASTFYQVTVFDNNNCTTSGGAQVIIINPPFFELGNDTTICQGESVSFDPGFVGTDFEWQDGSINRVFTATQTGVYRVTAFNSCGSYTDSVFLTVQPLPVVDLGPDQIRCERDTLFLDAGNPGSSYSWTNGQASQRVWARNEALYGVTVTSSWGCESYDEMNLSLVPFPTLELGPDFILCNGKDTVLDISFDAADRYLWQDGSIIPIMGVTEPGLYWGELENLCAVLRDTVEVDFQICDCNFFLPSAFSPNGDGMNDTFYPKYECNLNDMDMTIYNRWGQLIYNSGTPFPGWDGKYQGQTVQEGVYPFVVTYSWFGEKGLEKGRRMGTVTVIR